MNTYPCALRIKLDEFPRLTFGCAFITSSISITFLKGGMIVGRDRNGVLIIDEHPDDFDFDDYDDNVNGNLVNG